MRYFMIKLLLLSLLFLLSGCANDELYEAQEMINELQETIDDLEGIIFDLESEIEGREIAIFDLESEVEDREATISDLESEIEDVGTVISGLENEIARMLPSRHGWENATVESLIKNFESLNLADILGGTPVIPERNDITFIGGNNVIVTVGWEDMWPSIGVVLSFQREDEYYNWDHAILSWEVIGYTTGDGLRFIRNRQRNTDRLTDLETVTVRFYYYDRSLLYNLGMEEGLYYEAEEISGIVLREEFIRLMSDHADIEVWDLWYEDDILYVDLMPIERTKFGGQCGSSTHAVIQHRHNMLIRTLTSFSDAHMIRISIGGEENAMIGGFRPIGGTFHIVENGFCLQISRTSCVIIGTSDIVENDWERSED